MELLQSEKNNAMGRLENYLYWRKNEAKSSKGIRTYWRCIFWEKGTDGRASSKCPGIFIFVLNRLKEMKTKLALASVAVDFELAEWNSFEVCFKFNGLLCFVSERALRSQQKQRNWKR